MPTFESPPTISLLVCSPGLQRLQRLRMQTTILARLLISYHRTPLPQTRIGATHQMDRIPNTPNKPPSGLPTDPNLQLRPLTDNRFLPPFGPRGRGDPPRGPQITFDRGKRPYLSSPDAALVCAPDCASQPRKHALTLRKVKFLGEPVRRQAHCCSPLLVLTLKHPRPQLQIESFDAWLLGATGDICCKLSHY